MGELYPGAQPDYADEVVTSVQDYLRQEISDIRAAGKDPADYDPWVTGLRDEIVSDPELTRDFLRHLRRDFSFVLRTPEEMSAQGIDPEDPLTMLRWLSALRKQHDV